MTDATAKLKNYRQSPRKVRLVADLVRGKTAEHAIALLNTLPKRASEAMIKLIQSAVANAKMPAKDLVISTIQVNGGVVFKRAMPRARGRSAPIRKKTSVITLGLSKRADKKAAPAAAK
ncbi:MAG TPA: 50S ribosomal protein L22 [Candidatus Paceibacterota bacterium]